MKLKRSKAYRRAIAEYERTFGFRPPFQVLVDAAILEDAFRQKIDLVARLQSVLHGPVKVMVSTCEMRKLYNAKPKNEDLILQAKQLERRRCGHIEHAVSTAECLSSVVDPKDTLTNKHHLLIATQDPKIRAHMRRIPGVPILYISKSVLILEPISSASNEQREIEEKSKFRKGLKGSRNVNVGQKRKRDDEDEGQENQSVDGQPTGNARPEKKKRAKGPKGPNPLSVKKSKRAQAKPQDDVTPKSKSKDPKPSGDDTHETDIHDGEGSGHRKRKRKHKPKVNGRGGDPTEGEQAVS